MPAFATGAVFVPSGWVLEPPPPPHPARNINAKVTKSELSNVMTILLFDLL
jgi:hypothetical protein